MDRSYGPPSGGAPRLLPVFAVLLSWLTPLLELPTGMDGAVTVAASVAALLLCGPALLAPRVARAPVPGLIRTTIRDRALRTAFLPQRDPDASGRPRPRAPGRLQGRSPHRSGGLGPLRLAAWPSPAL